MRVVVQRVTQASVDIEEKRYAEIGMGLLVFLGIESTDTAKDSAWLVKKLLGLRIFSDREDKMNLSVCDVLGDMLVVSQFTLYASTRKGNRPSYIRAAPPDIAGPLYESFIAQLRQDSGLRVQSGVFAAEMKISLINSGPVTIIIDSKQKE